LAIACGITAVSIAILAQTPASTALRFTATTENVSGAGEPIKINLSNWSTDTDRDQLITAWNFKPAPVSAEPAAVESRGGRGGRAAGRGGRGGRGAAAAAPADLPADPDAVDPDNPAFRFGRGGARGRGNEPAPDSPQGALAVALKRMPTIGI